MPIATFWVELRLALAVFVISLLLGALSGYWVLTISCGLLGFIVWQLRQMMHLRQWLAADAPLDKIPNVHGSAYQTITQICNLKQLNQDEKNNLMRLLDRFDAATRAMPDAMLIVDSTQSIEWANPAANTLLGIDPYRDIGQRIDNIVRDPDITNYLQAGDYREPLEFSSSDSTENDLTLTVVSYDDGKRLFIVHDHGDRLKLQHMRKAFVSNASHEMRTPLTVIIGYLETLALREEMPVATRRGVEGALEQAQRLKQLIDDLLSLSRLENLPLNKHQLQDVDICTLIRNAVELVKSSDLYRQHDFILHLDDNLPIAGDPGELHSAIQNILDNAVKYSPEHTSITITWERADDHRSVLTLQDSGEGISASHLPRLTERFYRVDHGRSRELGGTGLGLSIVKHIMERHAGELRINSRSGKGTCVQLYFPSHNKGMAEQAVSA